MTRAFTLAELLICLVVLVICLMFVSSIANQTKNLVKDRNSDIIDVESYNVDTNANGLSDFNVVKTPHGWLVCGFDSMTYVPDEEHKWLEIKVENDNTDK